MLSMLLLLAVLPIVLLHCGSKKSKAAEVKKSEKVLSKKEPVNTTKAIDPKPQQPPAPAENQKEKVEQKPTETGDKKTEKEGEGKKAEKEGEGKKAEKEAAKEEEKKPEEKRSELKPQSKQNMPDASDQMTLPPAKDEKLDDGTYEALGPVPGDEGEKKKAESKGQSQKSIKYQAPPPDQRPKKPENTDEVDHHDKGLRSLELIKNEPGFE